MFRGRQISIDTLTKLILHSRRIGKLFRATASASRKGRTHEAFLSLSGGLKRSIVPR